MCIRDRSPPASRVQRVAVPTLRWRRSARTAAGTSAASWSRVARRPITPARLGERLRTLGVRALPGRRATLLQLAAEVPAAVLADLLHLSVGTATRWTRDAGGDWSRYAAELARIGGHGT